MSSFTFRTVEARTLLFSVSPIWSRTLLMNNLQLRSKCCSTFFYPGFSSKYPPHERKQSSSLSACLMYGVVEESQKRCAKSLAFSRLHALGMHFLQITLTFSLHFTLLFQLLSLLKATLPSLLQ